MKRDGLDALFSLFIRRRDQWTCQRCHRPQRQRSVGFHSAHIFGRGKLSVRFDTENGVGLCYGCHRHLDTHPEEKTAFAIRHLGQDRYNALAVRASMSAKIDPIATKLALTALLNTLEGE